MFAIHRCSQSFGRQGLVQNRFFSGDVMGLEGFIIGLIFPDLVDFGPMCWGAFDAARKHNASAICFQGNPLQSPIGFSSQSNILYDLITPETPLDGLVIWTGWLGQFVGAAEAARFCRRFAPVPVVSISQKIDGIPSILSDNHQSMECVIRHLVEAHDCRRLAFINGPENHIESAERYRAYADLLRQYGLPFDPTLVMREQFTHEAGKRAGGVLLDERRVSFDAVITGDDFVALGVIEAIQMRGLRVPDDIAVVGFDDTPYARASIPPLTTIHQSPYDQGFQGVELLLAQLNNDSYPMEISLPTRLMVRQSCGCSNPVVVCVQGVEKEHLNDV
jgi:DNA-binding LacI/PurR family transcriptional regulator